MKQVVKAEICDTDAPPYIENNRATMLHFGGATTLLVPFLRHQPTTFAARKLILENMPRKPPADLDDRLIEYIANNPSGLGIDELLRLFKDDVSRRTLQLRLSTLVKTGRLISEDARFRLQPSEARAWTKIKRRSE